MEIMGGSLSLGYNLANHWSQGDDVAPWRTFWKLWGINECWLSTGSQGNREQYCSLADVLEICGDLFGHHNNAGVVLASKDRDQG